MAERKVQGVGGIESLLALSTDRDLICKTIASYLRSHFTEPPSEEVTRFMVDSVVNQIEKPLHPAMWITSIKLLAEWVGFHPSMRAIKQVADTKPIRIFRVPYERKEGVA